MRALLSLVVTSALLAACHTSNHSALNPGGIQARRIAREFWVMLGICTFVFVAVLSTALWSFWRARKRNVALVDAATQSMLRKRVGAAVAASAVILVALMITDFALGRSIDTFSAKPRNTLTVHVTGHQWWWEFSYEDSVPERAIGASNELHIPTNRPVLLKLESHDVIHSFWVPGLQGKRDLIPGYTSMLWLRAEKPGIYEGQCAEFCGFQHAKMKLLVVAETPQEFGSWYELSMRPAVPPADSLTRYGQQVFLTRPCVMCHSIRGTTAGGKLGPDLTHIASQRRLAGNTIPNTRGHLAGWILDSQHYKPGNRMPPIQLEPQELTALLAYLESLK